MANWEMDSANVIDYSPNGDDIDRFSLKVKNNFEHIFTLLQLLHSNGATAGLNNDATSYEIRVDSSTDAMYIRNYDNTDWVFLGEVKENFGIKPETIGAVENGGGTGKLFTGTESAMADIPADSLETHDFYFAYDTTRLFTWTGTDWVIFLSRQFGDMLNYEKYCVAKAEVAYNGANKILRLDEETGKGNIDITGSPNRIWDKEIDLQDLQNNHVLTFNAEKNKWVNLPKDELFRKDLTYAGEAGKIVVVGEDGTIHANLTGSASKIDGITVDADGIEDKQILAYDFVHKAFVPVKKDLFDESSVTTEGMAGKLVRVHADGTIHADITGSTSQIAGLDVDISNRNVGYVLSISSTGTLKFIKVFNEDDVTTTGETGKLVRVADDGTIKGKIAGSATELSGVKIDTTNMKDGYVPVYNVESDTFIFKPKDEVAKTTSTETGEIGKNIIVSEDGTAHINITGSASAVDGVDVEISDLQDGDVLVYHVSTGTLRNEPKNTVGTGKSLILKDGAKVLGDYNGANTTVVDVAEVIENSNIKYVNIHLTMDIAGLNPGGYDNVATEIFKGTEKNIDNTQVNVTSAIVGDDSIDVATIEGLIVGGNYELTDGANLENVRIKDIRIVGDTKRVILYNDIVNSFNMANTILRRSNATVGEGFVGGDGVMFVTNLIPFTNEMTGEGIKMSRAHLTVKHQNVADAEIKAEVKMIKTQLKGHTPDLPIYLDMEDATIKTIGASKLSALAKDYCKRMNNNGYKCGVYASLSFWYAYLDSFAKTDTNYHWIAQYASYCAYANADDVAQYAQKNSWAYYKDYHYYETWQYSSTGKGSTYGVSSTYIDLDYWYGSLDLAKLATPENVTGGVLLNWANVSSAKKYYVQRKEADGSFTTIAKLTESEYIDTTVAKGTTYTYRIKYKTKNGTVGYSNKKKITYIKYVTLKKATSTKKGTIKVKFSKSKYATIWKIKYSRYPNFSSSKTLRLEGSLLNTATITGLTSAAKYYLKIKTFMKVDGKAYGSAFSNVLECTVK